MDFKSLKLLEEHDEDAEYCEEIIKKKTKIDIGKDHDKGRKRNKRRKVNTKVYDLGE